jgi:TRAP-type uncharacterized transport system substrate-binding protein
MAIEDLATLSRRDRIRFALLVVILIVVVVWVAVQFMKPLPSRHIVLASGSQFGLYHRYAQRYAEILARHGVTVEERMTSGGAENMRLLLDPKSGVEVAFMQGGIGAPTGANIVMIAALYYEPLWIFYRTAAPLSRIKELERKRLAVGVPGSGTRAVVEQLLAANGLTIANGIGRDRTDILGIGGSEAFAALREGQVDAAFFVGGAQTPIVGLALLDPAIEVMNLDRSDAYPRLFPYLTTLHLPRGTIDLDADIPHNTIDMIGTKAMLAARDDLHPALVNLLFDAATEVHAGQGAFETAGEFPNTAQVDLPVSTQADRHKRFGPNFLYIYLPFWVATIVERTIVLVVPVIVVLIPLVNYIPQVLRWRVQARVFRWYGELALLERDIATRQGSRPLDKWHQQLDRIERAVGEMKPPTRFASQVYTLREHIAFVRKALGETATSHSEPVPQ